jgi:hypothetical protein
VNGLPGVFQTALGECGPRPVLRATRYEGQAALGLSMGWDNWWGLGEGLLRGNQVTFLRWRGVKAYGCRGSWMD